MLFCQSKQKRRLTLLAAVSFAITVDAATVGLCRWKSRVTSGGSVLFLGLVVKMTGWKTEWAKKFVRLYLWEVKASAVMEKYSAGAVRVRGEVSSCCTVALCHGVCVQDVVVTGQSGRMTLCVWMSACCTDCVYTYIRSEHNVSQTTFRCGLADLITFWS